MKYDIFISYRRKDSSGRSNVPTARQFKLAFEAPPYNYKVFFDYSECTDNYFSDTILPAIRTCDFFVLVLTKDCLVRCVNEGDWVRREIEEAIASNRKIIPITPDKECETFPLDLPDSLRKTFKDLQITTVYTDHMFESSIDFLVKNRFHLNKALTDSEAESRAKEEAERERLEREQKTKQANGHEFVDLGLPSGTLWATCNVGTSKPEAYGDYYAWGETKTKSIYHWNTYKHANGNYNELTKYCNKSFRGRNGFADALIELQPSDDLATANWGNDWCTPSMEQWIELKENTKSNWITRNGVKCRLFTANNGNSLFLPAAGYRWNDELYDAGSLGYYWSRSLDTSEPCNAWCFNFISGYANMGSSGRSDGLSVRAVHSARLN